MLLETERHQVVEYCLKMRAGGLTPGTSGNISIFDPDAALMAISPSSLDYAEMTAADVVVLDRDANVVEGALRPSSEYAMHLDCYNQRPDIRAVVHTHSPKATSLAVLGWDLPAVHYMIAQSAGDTVRCAPYRLFGSKELSEAALKALTGRYACLLESHGVLAAGPDIGFAFSLAEQIEFCADVYLQAKMVAEPKILSEARIGEVIGQFLAYSSQKSQQSK